MRTYKYIFKYMVITLLVLGCTAEDLDYLPINQLTTEEIINDPGTDQNCQPGELFILQELVALEKL
jgi:hypothetical protein